MTLYAVGDIQGCLPSLKRLLDQIDFDPAADQLWSVGDIVNRGPQSLETLRFCRRLGSAFRMVLGNHDLHLMAVARHHRRLSPKDTLNPVLGAPDLESLISWLEQQPLLIRDAGYTMVHAGIPPQWSIAEAAAAAAEVEAMLGGGKAGAVYHAMYGNDPVVWHESLQGAERWRVIINYFTRMRFCDSGGRLELTAKLGPEHPPPGYAPWYQHPERKTRDERIIFGHWAALQGRYCGENLFPLDTGCVWGGPLRIMQLDTGTYHQSR